MSSKLLPRVIQSLRSVKQSKIQLNRNVPALADVNRSKKQHMLFKLSDQFKERVTSVANAPYGIQKEVIFAEIGGPFAANGVNGQYVNPLQKVVVQYCDLGGSSAGMREFILTRLPQWAKKNPHVEVIVQPRPFHHPHLRATYDNGHTKVVCVRNQNIKDIGERLQHYVDSVGMPLLKPRKPVYSVTESIRGIWTPFKEPALRVTNLPQGPKYLYGNQ
ncbi:hypothetical protein MP228_002705 [Amoeboaphelidium protococcarum]|nr:hypothetical protein MP228_002705 [Amoeboaphelidium protococcarum]